MWSGPPREATLTVANNYIECQANKPFFLVFLVFLVSVDTERLICYGRSMRRIPKWPKRMTRQGEDMPQSKLTDDKVRQIRERYGAGETQKVLSEAFGVAEPTISDVVRRKVWKHVKTLPPGGSNRN